MTEMSLFTVSFTEENGGGDCSLPSLSLNNATVIAWYDAAYTLGLQAPYDYHIQLIKQ